MERIIISLNSEDKAWLASAAEKHNISIAETIRRAITEYKKIEAQPDEQASFDRLLKKTKGIWSQGDGQNYIDQLRLEWH